jgi:hypothetical protein
MNARSFSLATERKMAFVARCRLRIAEARRAASTESVEDIVKRVAVEPAPGYFISYDRALSLVYGYLRLNRLDRPRHSPASRRIADIADEVEALMTRRTITIAAALALVLASDSAPEFYINPRYALRTYRECKALTNRKNT